MCGASRGVPGTDVNAVPGTLSVAYQVLQVSSVRLTSIVCPYVDLMYQVPDARADAMDVMYQVPSRYQAD